MMDELSEAIHQALIDGRPLNVEFTSGGRQWILSMKPTTD